VLSSPAAAVTELWACTSKPRNHPPCRLVQSSTVRPQR